MAKHKNQKISSSDHTFLKGIAEEQDKYIGREYKLDLANNMITIFALPQKKHKSKKEKRERDKRSEKFEKRD